MVKYEDKALQLVYFLGIFLTAEYAEIFETRISITVNIIDKELKGILGGAWSLAYYIMADGVEDFICAIICL